MKRGPRKAAPALYEEMDVTASDPSDAHFPGTSSGKTITLDAGSYSVDESGGPSTFSKDTSR